MGLRDDLVGGRFLAWVEVAVPELGGATVAIRRMSVAAQTTIHKASLTPRDDAEPEFDGIAWCARLIAHCACDPVTHEPLFAAPEEVLDLLTNESLNALTSLVLDHNRMTADATRQARGNSSETAPDDSSSG